MTCSYDVHVVDVTSFPLLSWLKTSMSKISRVLNVEHVTHLDRDMKWTGTHSAQRTDAVTDTDTDTHTDADADTTQTQTQAQTTHVHVCTHHACEM